MSVITRDVLAERLADWVRSNDGEMSMVAARDEVKWFFDTLATSLSSGDEVRIHGFGHLQDRAARRPGGSQPAHRRDRPGRRPPGRPLHPQHHAGGLPEGDQGAGEEEGEEGLGRRWPSQSPRRPRPVRPPRGGGGPTGGPPRRRRDRGGRRPRRAPRPGGRAGGAPARRAHGRATPSPPARPRGPARRGSSAPSSAPAPRTPPGPPAGGGDLLDGREERGVRLVEQPGGDVARGVERDQRDHHGDRQAGDRVELWHSRPGARDPGGGAERGEPVDARVLAVGDQREAAQPAPHHRLVAGHRLVAHEPDEGGGEGHPGWESVVRWSRCSTEVTPEATALATMRRRTTSPARSSPRW